MEQKKFWNSVADEKEFTTPFHFEEFSKFIKSESIILDIGCGYGRTLNELQMKGYKELIGIDFSEQMINRGRKQFPLIDFRIQVNKGIDLPDNSVDAIILFAVLTCIVTNEEQNYLITEIKRVLKPNGYIYVNDFLINDDERNQNRYKQYEGKYTYGVFELYEGAILRHHDWKYITNLFEHFVEYDMVSVEYTTMNGNKSNGFYYIGRNV